MNHRLRIQSYLRYSAVMWPIVVAVVGTALHVEANWALLVALFPAAVLGYASLWGMAPWAANRPVPTAVTVAVPQGGAIHVSEEVLGAVRTLDKSVTDLSTASNQAVYQAGSALPHEAVHEQIMPALASNVRREASTILQYVRSLQESLHLIQTTHGQVMVDIQHCHEEHNAMHTSVSEATECLRILTEALVGAEEVVTEMNFLALNASIEAAKSTGEGQSFTIIANNIRALHDQIQILVNNLRGGLNRLRSALGMTVQHAGVEAQQTSHALTGLQLAINQSYDSLGKLTAWEEAAQRLLSAVDEQVLETEAIQRDAMESRAQTTQIQAALSAVCAIIPGVERQFAEIVQKLEGRPSV